MTKDIIRPHYTYLAFTNTIHGVTIALEEVPYWYEDKTKAPSSYQVRKSTKIKRRLMHSIVWQGDNYLLGKEAFAKEMQPYL